MCTCVGVISVSGAILMSLRPRRLPYLPNDNIMCRCECPDLEELVLYGNPFHTKIKETDGDLAYAAQVMEALPGPKKLDGVSTIEWTDRMSTGNEKQLREVFI